LKGVSGAGVVGALGLVEATNWGFVKFRQESNSTVDPRYSEHLIELQVIKDCPNKPNEKTYRLPIVVPDIKGTSHTTSMDLAFRPITTSLTERGTLPESWTIVTLSPRAKRWFCRRWNAFHHGLLDRRCGLVFAASIRKLLDFSHSVLGERNSVKRSAKIETSFTLVSWSTKRDICSKSRTALDLSHDLTSRTFESGSPSVKTSEVRAISWVDGSRVHVTRQFTVTTSI
jgi:hypothetical protein